MKPIRTMAGAVLCSCLLATLPVASLPTATAFAADSHADALKDVPASFKRTVENAIDYFGLSDITVSLQGKRQVTIRNNAAGSLLSKQSPVTISLLFSEKDNRLAQLATTWAKEPKQTSPDAVEAASTARDFVESVIGDAYTVASHAALLFAGTTAEVEVYPIVHDIPLQKPVGRVMVNPAGSVVSYHRLETYIDREHLPSKAGILSAERAKAAIADQLRLELAFDDVHRQYRYIALPLGPIDAKTGVVLAQPAPFTDTRLTVAAGHKPASLSPDAVKELAQTYFGFQAQRLSIATSRESHPNETPIAIQTVTEGNQTLVVRTNERTGELLSIQFDKAGGAASDQASALSATDAQKTALGFIAQFLSLPAGDYLLRVPQTTDSALPSRLELYGYENGVRTAEPVASISYDLAAHTLTAVYVRPYSPVSATGPAVISTDAAKKQWLDALTLELAYVYPTLVSRQADQPALAYVPSHTAADSSLDTAAGTVVPGNK